MLVSGLHKEVLYSGPFRPYFFLLNIMRRSSPAFFEKKKKKKKYMGMPPPMIWALTRALRLTHTTSPLHEGPSTIGRFTIVPYTREPASDFFNLSFRSHWELNLGHEKYYSDHLTNSARGPFARL
jgi:hypothetical protein